MFGNKKKESTQVVSNYIVNMLIVSIILVIGWYLTSWYPFGESTFIFRDLQDQYLGFYEHFNNVLRGDESFMYSMYKGLGGSMYGLWTYYLMSPFNLIFLFFNGNNIITGVHLVYILKVLAMTVTATYYFNKKSVRQPLSMILTLAWRFRGVF